MSLLASDQIYRSASGLQGWMLAAALRLAPPAMALLRTIRPQARFFSLWVISRYDDVLEVFATDSVFSAPYHRNLEVITGGQPFFLGMDDTPEYRAQIAAMRAVVLPTDLPRLGDEAERLARARVETAGGRLEVVSFIRGIAFDLMARYFGIGEPEEGSLALWGSRLFEFQFTGSVKDKAWLAEARSFATAFQGHIDRAIVARRAVAAAERPDDVLTRSLILQSDGKPGYSDIEIRTAILCMIVGGPPQPPMVMPQAMDQLLRRPTWLDAAQLSARSGDDDRLRSILFEAIRFDPLAPGFKRTVLQNHKLARGTHRARTIPRGATVFVATASAMMDGHRIPDPARFDPDRQSHQYMQFGHGLHECFGRFINHATLHRMMTPLLQRTDLRRASGSAGRLIKKGPFAHSIEVEFG
jgi:cytochrome P450